MSVGVFIRIECCKDLRKRDVGSLALEFAAHSNGSVVEGILIPGRRDRDSGREDADKVLSA